MSISSPTPLEHAIGVLALQGDFEKHHSHLLQSNMEGVFVRYSEQLQDIDGLIIPGGESTTIGKLMQQQGLLAPLEKKITDGMPVFGTCAGAIVLADAIEGSDQLHMRLLDITVLRNAYGRQIKSFEADIHIPCLGREPFRSVFIRAPVISKVGPAVEVLGSFEGSPVLIRQGNMLAATFHPELTRDLRLHAYFIDMITQGKRHQ